MNKILKLLISILIFSSCSLNKNSKFWTEYENIPLEKNPNYKEIFEEEKALNKELNSNITINLGNKNNTDPQLKNYFNNHGKLDFNGVLKKSSRYKFSKIKNFYKFEPSISFNKKNLIFFDNVGSIVQFYEKSKLLWKKNYYSKSEKKLKPILQFANNNDVLIIADNISKYYAVKLDDGEQYRSI